MAKGWRSVHAKLLLWAIQYPRNASDERPQGSEKRSIIDDDDCRRRSHSGRQTTEWIAGGDQQLGRGEGRSTPDPPGNGGSCSVVNNTVLYTRYANFELMTPFCTLYHLEMDGTIVSNLNT